MKERICIILRKYDAEENFSDKMLMSVSEEEKDINFNSCCKYVTKLKEENKLGNFRSNADEEMFLIPKAVKSAIKTTYRSRKSFDILLTKNGKELNRRVFFA